MDVNYQYTKLRCNFGRQPLFCETGPLLCDTIATNLAEHKAYILRNPVHQLTQNTACYSERYINTLSAEHATTGCNHAEGGWPRDVAVADPELTQRYRRKVEKEDDYISCIRNASPALEHFARQNQAVDLFRTYHAELPRAAAAARAACRTLNAYRDPARAPRPVAALSWQPEGGARFAVAHADLDFDRRPRSDTACYVWDAENASAPEATLAPPSALLDLQFNQREPNMLAGALASGAVAVWDRRAGARAAAACAAHAAHRDLARSVAFVNAKSGREFFSGSADGAVKWWDVRNLAECTEHVVLDVVHHSFETPSAAAACGVSTLEFEPTMPSRFMVGTEDGYVIVGNRKGKTALEKLPAKFLAHLGPVWSLERNPSFLKNFVTVGDWTVRVWSEECRDSAVLWAAPARHRLTAAAWSPTRVSVLAVAQSDGVLALWDLLRRQRAPALAAKVCAEPLLRLRPHDQGSLIACGSAKGNVYMMEVSSSLAVSEKNDKALLTLVLDRESKRERILEARLREIRMKLKQAEDGIPAEAEEPDPTIELMAGDRDLYEATFNYNQQVKRELASM